MRGAAGWSTTAEHGPTAAACLLAFGLMLAPGLAAACSPHVEERGSSAMFRPHTTAFETCEVSEEAYRHVVADWLGRRPADAPPVTSLSLGRAVSFPWVSRHIADAALRDPRWNARAGKPMKVGINNLVATLLSEQAFLGRLGAPFERTGYAIAGVTVEKVLVGKAADHSSSPVEANQFVPFDAQVWIRLTRE